MIIKSKQKESEPLLRILTKVFLESAVPTIIEDLDGIVIEANNEAIAAYGWSRKELIGNPIKQIVPEDRHGQADELLRRCRAGEIVRDIDGFRQHKDGRRIPVLLTLSMLTDEQGEPTGIVTIAQDMTQIKRMESELIRSNKMEGIGKLAGGIAHNFNNILMGIQGRASLMMIDKDPSHPDYEHLQEIENCVRSAVELTKDLLGFARGGKYEVKPTDLNELIENENRTFGHTKKEISIHGNYEENLWAVEVDRGQIQQVLLNLYINAWQAMPNGGKLYVRTENVILDEAYVKPFKIASGRFVKISVTDTGTGMDDTIMDQVFDPFFTTKDADQGSGLGLASVYGIIKNHKGCINVISEKGKGTTFNIYLPASDNKIADEVYKSDRQNIVHGYGTVLLVDDEDMVIKVGQKMLEHLGYLVLIARNGKEALDIYKNQREDIKLVILDMIMPDMGGAETYDRLKNIDEHVCVLLSSGYSINGQAREIIKRGCVGFIQKPFSLNDLSITVKKTMGKADG